MEVQVVDADGAFRTAARHRCRVFLRRHQDVVDAREGHHGLAAVRQHAPKLPHRPDGHADVSGEGEEVAHADAPVDHHEAAGDEHEADLHEGEEVRDAPIPAHEPAEPVVVLAEGADFVAEAADLIILPAEGAHHADAGEVLLQHRGHRALGAIRDFEHALHLGEEDVGADHEKRHQRDGKPRQLDVEPEEDRQHRADEQDGAPHLHDVRGQENAHGFHVGTAPLHEVAGVRAVEERGADMVQAAEQLLAQAAANRFRRDGRPTPPQVQEHAAGRGQDHAGHGAQGEVGDVRRLRVEAVGERHQGGDAGRHVP